MSGMFPIEAADEKRILCQIALHCLSTLICMSCGVWMKDLDVVWMWCCLVGSGLDGVLWMRCQSDLEVWFPK